MFPGISRRSFNRNAALLAASAATAACWPRPSPLAVDGEIIDVHCHLFNGQDLPIVRFITKVVIPDNEAQAPRPQSLRGVEDPTPLELAFEWFKNFLLAGTPTARQEIDALNRTSPLMVAATKDGARARAVDSLTTILEDGADARIEGLSAPRSRTDRFRALLVEEADRATGADRAPAAIEALRSARDTALAAYDSQGALGVYLRWFTLFMRYRHSLADELAADLKRDGRTPVLLVPLMIDYSWWLRDQVASPLRDQVEVFDQIARRRTEAPAIHGMVAYDPLRAVYHGRRPDLEAEDPLAIVSDALDRHGFLGAKLYPPMGFRAAGNTDDQGYPAETVRDLRGRRGLGRDLNDALDRLYALCDDRQAPILAHAAITQGAGPGYAERTDPAYWIRALQKWPRLRLCLAHQGRFSYRSTAPETAGEVYEEIIGRHIRDNPDGYLYMDISYLSEALAPDAADRRFYAEGLGGWIGRYDPQAERILFGTDWIMVGQVKASPIYTRKVVEFLREDCGLAPDQVNRILRLNAGRYLGLRQGDHTRQRLLDRFYSVHGLAEALLPRFE